MDNLPSITKLQKVPTSLDVKRIISDDRAMERFLSSQVDLNSDGIYYEKDCVLCNSQSRKLSEERWLRSRDAEEIRTFLRERGEPVNITVVKNHMEFHIDQSYIELRKKEYINKIITLSSIHLDTLGRIELALASISERILSINATEDPDISISELGRIKSDATCKLVTSMTKLLELRANLMGEMQTKGILFSISEEDFSNIFTDILKEFDTDEARAIVNSLLDKFSKIFKKK